MEHAPDFYMRKITKCAYVEGAEHEDWNKALTALPPDVAMWMKARYGQAITGHMTPDDLLIVQNGTGSNGKSSVFAGMQSLGGYIGLLSDRVIFADPRDHPTELMDLQGLRMALIEETLETRRLNVQRLKKLIGTTQVTARHIRKDSVTFDATHSIFLSTNYRPAVEETDDGTWRRLALVTFPYTFIKPGETLSTGLGVGMDEAGDYSDSRDEWRPGDAGLRERLHHGDSGRHEAALAWMVAGARQWYDADKQMPEMPITVAMDTREWRAESDVVMAYCDERLEFEPGYHVASGDLLLDLNGWLENHGHKPWSAKLMATRFENSSEVRKNRVRQERVRKDQKTGGGVLSRPDMGFESKTLYIHLSDLGKQYRAWSGVRFANDTVSTPDKISPETHDDDPNPF
jgi:putative DNA primase/helicase